MTRPHPAFLVALATMVLAAIGFSAGVEYFGVYLRKEAIYARGDRRVDAIPAESDRFIRVGQDRRETAEVEQTLGTTNYVGRLYARKADPETPPLDFHAAYYTGGIDTVPHVPDRCFVGGGMMQTSNAVTLDLPVDRAGWVIDDSVSTPERPIYTVRTSNSYSDLPGRRVRLPRGAEHIRLRIMSFQDPAHPEQPLFAGYFFIANGGLVTTAEEVRQLSFDLTNDYAYFLKVQFTSRSVKTAEEFAARAGELLTDLLPEIVRCVPDWIEVERGEYPENNPRRAQSGAPSTNPTRAPAGPRN